MSMTTNFEKIDNRSTVEPFVETLVEDVNHAVYSRKLQSHNITITVS